MNFLLYVLSHVSNYFRTLILRLVIISIIFNILGTMSNKELVEKSPGSSTTATTHRCKHIGDFALRANCELWSCWESQLRDESRIQFLDIYNKFRTDVIQKQCKECRYYEDYPVMIQLWHWKLEQESQKAIKNCPYQDFKSNIKIHIDGDNSDGPIPMQCEMVATSFPIQSGSQSELIQMLPLILNSNHLHDFNYENKYRRSLASFIGCSYIPRVLTSEKIYSTNLKSKQSVGHLLCYFCSRENALHLTTDNLADCPVYTTKSKINDFPLLCKLKTNQITMPCESRTIPCPLWKKSYSWILPYRSDMIAELDNGTNLLMADYSNKFNFVHLSDSSSFTTNGTSEIIIVPLTPYITHVDPFDKKFCILKFMMHIFVLVLMSSALLLIYYFRLMTR